MRSEAVHTICTATFELKVENKARVPEFHEKTSALFHEKLTDVFERVLSTHDVPGQHHIIEKLVLDIGYLDWTNEWEAVKYIEKSFESELTKVLYGSRPVESYSLPEYKVHAFLYFLEHGHFEWASSFRSLNDLLLSLMQEKIDETDCLKVVNALRKFSALQRFYLQAKQDITSSFIEYLSLQTKVDSNKKYLDHLRANKFRVFEPRSNDEQADVRDNIEMEIAEELEVETKNLHHSKNTSASISVANAGIVLLNPFLTTLFSGLKLIDGKEFVSQDAAFRAVGILNYIATGTTVLNEHESTLFKVICGLDFNVVIPYDYTLSEAEKEECLVVLNSAIKHWEALKNTSPDGLRATFIQRNGLLKVDASHFVLTVERTAADVLLSFRPPLWTIGLISLPWMKKMLRVDWII
jgi:hypothetical protein